LIHAENGKQALDVLFNTQELPSIILLDVNMPEMNGYDTFAEILENPKTANIPVLFITASENASDEARGLSMGAVDYITKPFVSEIIKMRVRNHVELKTYRDELEKKIDEKVAEIIKAKEDMISTMANIIEYRSRETGEHVKRTMELTGLMIAELIRDSEYSQQLSVCEPDVMVKASALHDIGKIAIPDNILLKPGRLTDEEYETIKTHAEIGGDMVKMLLHNDTSKYAQYCYEIARHHHERYDGNGYPDKLQGQEIPLSARILAVIDVYDALASKRVYKDTMSHEKAVSIIKEGRGTQFDPAVTDALLKIQFEFPKLYGEQEGK
jgi:putative two-component system response regulator